MTGERDLTAEERAIIDFVIRHGMRSGRDAALAQLAVARHAGLSHEGEDVCFEIATPDGVPPIEGSSSPVGLAVRPNDEILCGGGRERSTSGSPAGDSPASSYR